MAASPLNVAMTAAKRAGGILMDAYGGSRTSLGVTQKAHGEQVCLADLASNDAIVREISRAFPSDGVLSEESDGVDAAPPARGRSLWIIDPLDGTANYVNHIPLFAIAIARVVDGVARVAVIYDPLHDELFAAERGKGARLNGKAIRVSDCDVTRGAMLFAGRGYRDHDRARHGKIIYSLERRTPYFRRLGSAAHMLSAVACGRADTAILTGSRPWDTVAGTLLVREAGGKVTDYHGRRWTPESDDLVASNGHIHGEIVNITKSARSE
jgi:myo-inositol-1(or 4)-monophosphatase